VTHPPTHLQVTITAASDEPSIAHERRQHLALMRALNFGKISTLKLHLVP
jgi:hypothetical protein